MKASGFRRHRLVMVSATLCTLAALPIAFVAGLSGSSVRGANPVASPRFGTLAGPTGSVGPTGATGAPQTTVVDATTTSLSGGGEEADFSLPGGITMSVPTPPADFNPLTASAAQLAEFDFPPRPTDPSALAEWTTAMSAYQSDGPPADSISVTSSDPAASYSTYREPWAGFAAGTFGTTGNTYVAVKAEQTVPSHSGTCGATNGIGIWVGLGGTTGNNDLVQQGIECGNSVIGSGGAFRPFTEFANTQLPIVFCGQTSWTFPAGDVVYQNMGYEQSPKIANFYIENITTGVAHSCSLDKPSGWSYNGDTADYIVEPTNTNGGTPNPLNYGSIPFSDARAELNSDGSWVDLGTQTRAKFYDGASSSDYCFYPSTVGSDNTTFSDKWYSGTCY
jgi:hypothetical protein